MNPDVIIHLAAISSIRDSLEKPFSIVETNTIGTMNVIHSTLELPNFKDKRILYASSGAIYGRQKIQPITEDTVPDLRNPYVISKAVTENYLKVMNNVYKLNYIAMRPTNTYGRKLDKSLFVEYLVTNMLTDNTIYVGAIEDIRDYLYVDDHVDAYVKALERPEVNNEAFNLGTGIGISNKELAFKIADMIGFDRSKILLNQYPPGFPFRPGEVDQPILTLDSTKIQRLLGWKARVKLDDGIRKTIDFWKQKLART